MAPVLCSFAFSLWSAAHPARCVTPTTKSLPARIIASPPTLLHLSTPRSTLLKLSGAAVHCRHELLLGVVRRVLAVGGHAGFHHHLERNLGALPAALPRGTRGVQWYVVVVVSAAMRFFAPAGVLVWE